MYNATGVAEPETLGEYLAKQAGKARRYVPLEATSNGVKLQVVGVLSEVPVFVFPDTLEAHAARVEAVAQTLCTSAVSDAGVLAALGMVPS